MAQDQVLGKRSAGDSDDRELPTLNEDEAKLYDRQIRLWGVEAQSRMRRSRVLMAGLGGLMGEACKNLVLAGIGTAYLLDARVVQEQDLAAQFFLTPEDIGKNRAEASVARVQELNPRVEVVVDTAPLESKDAAFFEGFDVVCITESPDLALTIRVNEWCHSAQVPFFAGDLQGLYGFLFMDHVGHRFTEKVTQRTRKQQKAGEGDELLLEEEEETLVDVTSTVACPTLEAALRQSPWGARRMRKVAKHFFATAIVLEYRSAKAAGKAEGKDLAAFQQEYLASRDVDASFVPLELTQTLHKCHCVDLNPVAAIVGGILGQEVIKVLSAKSKPLLNFFLFDGAKGPGYVELVEPASATAAAAAAAAAPPADIVCL